MRAKVALAVSLLAVAGLALHGFLRQPAAPRLTGRSPLVLQPQLPASRVQPSAPAALPGAPLVTSAPPAPPPSQTPPVTQTPAPGLPPRLPVTQFPQPPAPQAPALFQEEISDQREPSITITNLDGPPFKLTFQGRQSYWAYVPTGETYTLTLAPGYYAVAVWIDGEQANEGEGLFREFRRYSATFSIFGLGDLRLGEYDQPGGL